MIAGVLQFCGRLDLGRMVASADLTKQLGLDPSLSMSLFKSPEYAQEVCTKVVVNEVSIVAPEILANAASLNTYWSVTIGVVLVGQAW